MAYDRRLAHLGLNLTQATILSYVADFGPATQTRLADHLGNGRAATGAMIDRLEQVGAVARLPDPADRRVWLIALTPSGADLVRELTDVDQLLRTELRAGISRAERQAFADVLRRIQANLGGAAVESPLAEPTMSS